MRITNGITYNEFLKNFNTNATTVQKTLNQLSSLKKVNQASDNPLLVSKIIDLNSSISRNQTFGQTIKDSLSWVNTQDSSLEAVGNSMLRIRSLIQSSANGGTMGEEELQANKTEIGQEIRSIIDSLNTSYDGRYIFSGQNTTTKPFSLNETNGEITGITYQGSTTNLSREIASGVTIDLPTNGEQVLNNGTDGKGLSEFFNGILTAVDTGDTSKLSDTYLKEIDEYRTNVTNMRTQIGAISNRLQSSSSRNDTQQIQLKESLSENQDVDVVQKYLEYQNQMVAYRATLAMGTKIMQTSILDYL
ncbi:flagellar hook-associated protein FlgL [Enterococcus italicus]|uniref:flagellar hook-associated protein FlgL n=1 Tax=Enterococcus italicus TaxID=246144 RepID=UPI002073F6CF|nr:flagellar hook-associated protein FlgL [Enterococcus italicus]